MLNIYREEPSIYINQMKIFLSKTPGSSIIQANIGSELFSIYYIIFFQSKRVELSEL